MRRRFRNTESGLLQSMPEFPGLQGGGWNSAEAKWTPVFARDGTVGLTVYSAKSAHCAREL